MPKPKLVYCIKIVNYDNTDIKREDVEYWGDIPQRIRVLLSDFVVLDHAYKIVVSKEYRKR